MRMRLIKCECCDETFHNVSSLASHMTVHMKKDTADAQLGIPSTLDITTTTMANEVGTASTCSTDVASVSCDGSSGGSPSHSATYSPNIYLDTFLKANLQPSSLQPRKSVAKRTTFTCELCYKCFSNGRLLSFHHRKHQAEREEEQPAEAGQQPQKCKLVLEAFVSSSSETEDSESEERPKEKASPNLSSEAHLRSESTSQGHSSDAENPARTNQEILDSNYKTGNENLEINLKTEPEPTTKEMDIEDSASPDQICDTSTANNCPVVERRTSPRKRKPIVPLPLLEDDLQIAYASGMVIDLKCIPCGKTFKRRSHLNRHLRIHTRVAEVICKYCKQTYDNQSMLAEHVMEQHQGSRAYQCSFCDKTFKTSSHLMRHRRIHTGIRPYMCSFCEKGFTDKTSLTSHLVTHTGIKDHKCEICRKAFSRNTHLIRHMKLHERNEDNQMFECKYCRLLFPCQEKLKAHVTLHSKTCHVCDKAFRNLSRLTRHMSRHTREQAYKCQICSKVFSDTRDLATHISTHTDDKEYTCGFCPKTFTCQLHCEAHKKVHIGRQPFGCQFCNKKFPDPSSLTEHLQCHHSGRQLYACMQCPESFDHLDDLNKHLSTHEEKEKPYKCDRCDRTFSDTTTLTSHVRTHVEKKLFECQYCLKRFLTRAHQNRHLRIHADEIAATLHFCQVCQIEKNRRITFPNRDALDAHMLEFHPDKLPLEKGKEKNNSSSGRAEVDNPVLELGDNNKTDPCDAEAETSASKIILPVVSPADCEDLSLGCLICHRQFTRANNLAIHLRCHTGERPYSCTTCDMKFALSGTLRRHMRTHSGEKPFKCHVCLRKFGASYSLKRHLRVHAAQSESGTDTGKLKTDEEEGEYDDDEHDDNDKNNNRRI